MASLPKPSTVVEALNFTVLRIVAANQQTGKSQIGTGYVCLAELAKSLATYVLITNRHVIDGANTVSFDVHWASSADETRPVAKVHTSDSGTAGLIA